MFVPEKLLTTRRNIATQAAWPWLKAEFWPIIGPIPPNEAEHPLHGSRGGRHAKR
jgi:hypothetical protein